MAKKLKELQKAELAGKSKGRSASVGPKRETEKQREKRLKKEKELKLKN